MFNIVGYDHGLQLDPDVLLFVDPASGDLNDHSFYGMPASSTGNVTIVGDAFNIPNPMGGSWSFPGDSINFSSGNESVTYEGFWEFATPVPSAARLLVWWMSTTYGGPRLSRIENSLDGSAAHLEFDNASSGIFGSADASPSTPTRCHVCLQYRGSDDGTPTMFMFLDGVLQGSAATETGKLPVDGAGSWQLGGASQCGTYKMGQFRCKRGLQYNLAGFTPPVYGDLTPYL